MNLPAQWTGLIGRGQELAELPRLLSRARLVTLTGTGGVGKTRLALAVAENIAARFADGVAFVDLAPAINPEAVPAAIARSLGIRDDGELPLVERLANALRDRELLLILDNFEHVLPAGPLALELLQAAPGLTVLVTSRAALRVRGEREFPVAPLGFPAPTANETVDALLQYPALALFVRRAQDVRPDFTLAPATAASVAEICRRLDGLPLALELAAARIRVLSPEAMLARLGQGLALLGGGPRDLPARQQTLRATIGWSYDLLTPAEQAVFRRLAVFAGSVSLDAATTVVGNSDSAATLDLLASLVEKNLLWQAEGPGSEPRFRMLETVREFGLEQLEACGEVDSARRAHADFFVALTVAGAPHLRRAHREPWLGRIDAEMDNLRSVVAWSSTNTDHGDAIIRIVCALGFLYWRIRGDANEGVRWGELALAAPAAQPLSADRMRLLCATGGLAAYMDRFAVARTWLEESARLARESGDLSTLGSALVFLGFAESHLGESIAAAHMGEGISTLRAVGDLDVRRRRLIDAARTTAAVPTDTEALDNLVLALNVAVAPYALLGDLPTARATLAECLAIARELGDDWAMAVALSNAGFLDIRERNWASAAVHLEQSMAIHHRLGDEGSVAILYNNLAVVARNRGDDADAVALLEQSLAMQRRVGLTGAITLYNLGDWALRQGDIARATTDFTEALQTGLRTSYQHGIEAALDGLARLAATVGQLEMAARLIGAAEALRARVGLSTTLEVRRELDRVAAMARSSLGEAAFRAAVTDGERTPLARLAEETLAWTESAAVLGSDVGTPSSQQTAAPATAAALSAREIEVLQLIASGKSNREIATTLTISHNTVARHVSNIFDKVGAANRTEAAAYAHRHLPGTD